MNPSPRKTTYVGCFGYNDSPEELGEPSGFWQFPSYAKMWGAFEISEGLNKTFDALGEPTYSAILLATDADGYILFHLLVLSVKRIYLREKELLESAKIWMLEAGIAWNIPESEDEEYLPPRDLPF
jgi:hypothetical protein